MKNTHLVDYQEALSIKVGRFLLSKGFELADEIGVAKKTLVDTCALGILRKDPKAKPRKYLLGLIKVKPRRSLLGTVWFSNHARGVTNQNWLLEAYGRMHIELLRELVYEMASTFEVKITLRLVQDHSIVETYMSDYPM